MNQAKHFLIAVLFFIPSLLCASDIVEMNLENLFLSHPLMQNYDPLAGGILGTKSAKISVNELQKCLEEETDKSEQIKEKKKNLLSEALLSGTLSDETFFERVKHLDAELLEAEREIRFLEMAIERGGQPSSSIFRQQITDILNELVLPISSSDAIRLNKLPCFPVNKYSSMPKEYFYENFFKETSESSESEQILLEYLKRAYEIKSIFPSASKTLIWRKK